ncbi:MAG: hypothetical protein ACRDTC_24655 [Pseudonocardiaceae bacterium]
MAFDVAAAAQERLMEILADRSGPRFVRKNSRRIVATEDYWKELALADERERLIGEASAWLGHRLCGSFVTLTPRRHPTVSLLLTELAEPATADKTTGHFLRALNIGPAHRSWRCTEFPGLTLHPQREPLWLPNSDDRYTLAGRYATVLPDEVLRGYGSGRTVDSILNALEDREFWSVLVALSISALLQRHEAANAQIRDLARRTHRSRMIASSRRLRDSLLTNSLDVSSLAADIGDDEGKNKIAALLRRRQLDFEAFGYHEEVLRDHSMPTNFWDQLFASQVRKVGRLRNTEQQLRAILSSVTSINSTIASFRLQRVALLVTTTSAAIAIVALLLSLEFRAF